MSIFRKALALTAASLMLSVPVLAEGPTEGRAGRAELRYMEGMIDHHQMALDMSNDCLVNASAADLMATCQAIIDAQTAEIVELQGWLLAWYNVEYAPMPMAADDEMAGMDHGTMEGMPNTDPAMMMGMMAGLNRLEGAAYDVAWMESMIDHHDDAIHMSERLLGRVGEEGHDELKALAQHVIDAQSAEIEVLEGMIAAVEG